MRYAALNNEMDLLSKFGDFIPRGENYRSLPDPSTQLRYSEEQLYALSKYVDTGFRLHCSGFKGYGVTTRAVPGHEFGLRLFTEDKKALVAFLKTL